MIIKQSFLHHTGGLGDNRFASTIHLTAENIENAHAKRWPLFKSELNGSRGGYTAVIFPDGSLFQFRFIGEETAAQKGHNNGSVAFCVVGNYMKYAWGSPVDQLTPEAQEKIAEIQDALTNGDIAGLDHLGLKTKLGTTIDVKLWSIYPHRKVAQTACNGTWLPDNWGRDITIKLKTRKITLLQKIILLYTKIQEFFRATSSRLTASLVPVKKELPVTCLEEDVFG